MASVEGNISVVCQCVNAKRNYSQKRQKPKIMAFLLICHFYAYLSLNQILSLKNNQIKIDGMAAIFFGHRKNSTNRENCVKRLCVWVVYVSTVKKVCCYRFIVLFCFLGTHLNCNSAFFFWIIFFFISKRKPFQWSGAKNNMPAHWTLYKSISSDEKWMHHENKPFEKFAVDAAIEIYFYAPI